MSIGTTRPSRLPLGRIDCNGSSMKRPNEALLIRKNTAIAIFKEIKYKKRIEESEKRSESKMKRELKLKMKCW